MSDPIVITGFFGMNRRMTPSALPPHMAQQARDVQAISGHLEGRREDAYLAPHFGGTDTRRLYRAEIDSSSYWLTFNTPNADVVRAPLVNDVFDRYYWATENAPPGFTTRARLEANSPSYLLGSPRPTVAPTLTVTVVGVSAVQEDRAYVYSYIDEYGHESAPSDPTFSFGLKTDATVRVNVTASPVAANRPVPTKVRIYRTVPGFSSTAFFYVGEIAHGVAFFTDDRSLAEVALNETLTSTSWFPPPADMAGMVVMPNGFLAGFRGKDVLFSVPYRPHAWPTEYTISVEDTIVGLAVFDTNLAILTTGTPYVAAGVAPESMSLRKVGPANACLSRRSIVDVPGAVLYAGEDGLVSLTASGHAVVTKPFITRDDWASVFSPSTLLSARDSERTYVGFYSQTEGFQIDFSEPDRGVVFVTSAFPVQAFDTDSEGRRAIIGDTENAYTYSLPGAPPLQYTWRSKVFHMPMPVNMGAIQLDGVDPRDASTVTVTVIADGVTKFSVPIPLNRGVRLPSGYMAQTYEIELTGTAPIRQVVVAETMKGLQRG